MRKILHLTLFIFCSAFFGYTNAQNAQEIIILHINDVYEIAPLANGTVGGMARVATIYKALKQENPNTFFVHAGDFINPSVIGTLSYEGKVIKGKQMIEAMNIAGVQYVTLGNHEFDVAYQDLQERINESAFTWVCANTQYVAKDQSVSPFFKESQGKKSYFPASVIWKAGNLRVGLIGLLYPMEKDFLKVTNPIEAAQKEYNRLKDSTEIVLALTHQSIEEDTDLAKKIPAIPLIMGGHEHDNMRVPVGASVICKADANVKTVYIHRLRYDFQTKKVSIESELKKIDSSIPDDPETALVVNKWLQIADKSARAIGLNPTDIVMETKEPLDGLESSVRNKSTNLTRLIGKAMKEASPASVAAIYNGGSIRIDDKIEGKVTQYDILRVLPFGGQIFEMEIRGKLLLKILKIGLKNKGKGGYLHHANIEQQGRKWKIGESKIKKNQYYRIAITDFLLTGKEAGLEFLTEQNPDIKQVIKPDKANVADLRNDIRKAIVAFLKKQ